MKHPLLTALICCTCGLALAQADTNTSTPTAKVHKKQDPKSSRVQLRSQAKQVAAGVVAAETALTPEELAVAARIETGSVPCELGNTVTVTADGSKEGYFMVQIQKLKYRMHPVLTSTGAIRLEDEKLGAVWLQLANKSMLMNQKLGQRLADECKSAAQVAVADAMKNAPPGPSLIDTSAPAK